MSDRRNQRDSGDNYHPPMSRLFVICNKSNTEEEFREHFSKFGHIEEIWMVKDKHSGDNKGVAYVKFSKTSEAARALEEMNGRIIGNTSRPIKVLVASSKGVKRTDNEEEQYLRLFVLIPKDLPEEDLRSEFNQWGIVESVSIIRDKQTKQGKGFAYIKFQKFSHAAIAFEQCNEKYKAVFAEPKPSKNNIRESSYDDCPSHSKRRSSDVPHAPSPQLSVNSFGGGFAGSGETATLSVICSPHINQDMLWKLFDIIPGLDYCQITEERARTSRYATVVYNNEESASYARSKLHGLEYPPGERLIVKGNNELKPNVSAAAVFNMDSGSRDSFCSIELPPVAPMANFNDNVMQRCFVVCTQQALPATVLRNVFCRFGNLIDVYLLPNKNCGYAKYSTEESAKKAIDTLNNCEVQGIRIKVMEAEEPKDDRRKRLRRDEYE